MLDVSRVTTAPAVVVLVVATKEVGNPCPVEEVAGAPGADQATGCATNPSSTTWEGEARAEAAHPSYPNTSHHPSEASHPSAEEEASRYFFISSLFNTMGSIQAVHLRIKNIFNFVFCTLKRGLR